MRENNRNSIEKCRKKLPQFTTMNVIDGQAGLISYFSLIFYSLTIDNILNIIVLLILAAVAINLTIVENGIFTRAQEAVNKYEQSEVNEQDELNKVINAIDDYMNGNGGENPGEKPEEPEDPEGEFNTGTTIDEAKKQNKPFEKDTTIKDDLQNEVRIPGDFI